MGKITFCLFTVLLWTTMLSAQQPETWDVYADTWVATDDLGRQMPTVTEVGPLKEDQKRVVGIFYITWHDDGKAKWKAPYDGNVDKILSEHPEARLDGKHPAWKYPSYHWAEPEMGYFLSRDAWVARKDMAMLTDAGVDVLIMDVTNAVRYWDEWKVVFSVMDEMRREGNQVPKFCFWSYNGPSIQVVQELYEKIYVPEKYKELWFYWDGKPLMLYNSMPNFDANRGDIKHPHLHYDAAATTDTSHPHYGDPKYTTPYYEDYTPEVKEFFTLRSMWWGYYKWGGKRYVGTEDNWSFGYDLSEPNVKEMDPSDLVATHNGKKEQAAVTPAQHASSAVGKCWTREKGTPELDKYDLPVPMEVPGFGVVDNPEAYGIYFQNRWDEALAENPEFIYINDWNEWTAGKYHPKGGFPFLGRQSDFFFVDQYNAEFNRGIQPMKGGYTDNYYMQMVQNIRRYKGVRPIPEAKGFSSIAVDGRFDDWQGVQPEYRDTINDVVHRDYPGYGGNHYTNTTGRNDIVLAKVASDKENLYFYVQTQKPLTPHTDPDWMRLLIDLDGKAETGWCGYELLVDDAPANETATTIQKWEGEQWGEAQAVKYRYSGQEMEIQVPRSMLNLNEGEAFQLDFHWADNTGPLENAISLCVDGDSAPNRRFNYRCIWKPGAK